MYLSKYTYDQYFGNEHETTNYELLEDLAITTLKKYCLQFPTLAEYIILDEDIKGLIAKAILWQAHYEEERLFDRTEFTSVTAGKFSYSTTNNKSPYDLNAVNFLLDTGICDNRINKVGCGCPCE